MNETSPSRKPGMGSDMSDVFALGFRKEMLDVDDMLPAKIVAWDKGKNRAQVEILYLVTMTDGSVNPMLAPAEVPTLVLGGGDLCLCWPLKAGDLGWIKSADRDISLFLQEYNAQPGNTPRIHTFEDAMFIPDVMKDFVMVDGAAACLQTKDGSTGIAIKSGNILLKVGDNTTVMTTAGTVFSKQISAPNAIINGIPVVNHTHSNPEGGNVGPFKAP